MELFPAIDLRAGQAVRLVKGDFAKETGFGDPVSLAQRYVAAGAKWIHVVDLDAARTGHARHRKELGDIVDVALGGGAKVQTGGGIRSETDIDEVLALGVERVIVGTKAIEDASFLATAASTYGERLCVGLDYRFLNGKRELAVHGWEEGGEVFLDKFLRHLESFTLGALIITAIDKDGTLEGPDRAGLFEALELSSHTIVASGGVGVLTDIAELRAMRGVGPRGQRGLAGVVAGRALVNGAIDMDAAVKSART